jgi:hypothetical protein
MKREDIIKYGQIPQPAHEELQFVNDLARQEEFCFAQRYGYAPDADSPDLGKNVCFDIQFPTGNLDTAYASLRLILEAKGISEKPDGIRIRFMQDFSFGREEYRLKIGHNGIELTAADEEGMRRGIYCLEDKLRETEGKSAASGEWRRKAYVRHRISRCFFGLTYRPPFFIDELTNDIDYYPEEYLDKLAHEGVNRLWLSMYFRDLKSSLFPKHGELMEKRFAKSHDNQHHPLRWRPRPIRAAFRLPSFFSGKSRPEKHTDTPRQSDAYAIVRYFHKSSG